MDGLDRYLRADRAADVPAGGAGSDGVAAGYLAAGIALLVVAVLDYVPAAARYRGRVLPVTLCAMAAAGGLAATAGFNENNCAVTLASLAATAAAIELRRWQAWLVVLCSAVTLDANAFIFHDGFPELSTFLLYPFVPVTGLLLGHFIRTRQEQGQQAAALLARTQQLQAEQSRTEVLNERARIAREIHDVLAHSLGALSIQIQAARAVLTDHQDIDRALEVLSAAQRMAADGLTETRRAVHALRSDAVPLEQELSQAARTHRERYGTDAAFTVGGRPRPLPPEATVALLRTAQEALVNAAKHAPGQRVSVRLDYGDDVSLTIVNDLPGDGSGRGSGPGAPCPHTVDGGYGLTGMRERLRLLNGTLVTGPQDGHWVVAAGLPLATSSPSAPPADVPHPAPALAS
jgi:signal transduction histidine kinase